MIKVVADKVALVTTSTASVVSHKQNIRWRGHLSPEEWMGLLAESKFLMGLGHPLLGPSAIDAISVGCMLLNPIYDKPVVVRDEEFSSQHPYAGTSLGDGYVCSYKMNDASDLLRCVDKALTSTLPFGIPPDFTRAAYRQRVIDIFKL